MIKIRTVRDMGEGYTDIIYSAQRAGSPVIGTYRIMFNRAGRPYGAGRDYHRKLAPGEQISTGCLNACQHHGGAESECDGSSLVSMYTSEAERWAYAEMMAG